MVTVADQLVSALFVSEALGCLFLAGCLAYKLLRPRNRRRVTVYVCEEGHRCWTCEGVTPAKIVQIDAHREELIQAHFEENCQHICRECEREYPDLDDLSDIVCPHRCFVCDPVVGIMQ